MIDLADRLRELGDELALEDRPLSGTVLVRLEDDLPERSVAARWTWAAAAAVIALVAVSLAIPGARRAVADWFGIGSVSVERRPDLEPPATTTPFGDAGDATDLPDGRAVLVTRIDARLDVGLARKTVGTATQVVETTVAGGYALWIDGEPHLVTLLAPDGAVVAERVAGNTLLWQEGSTVVRLEGFDDRADAVAYAESLG